MGLNKGLLRQTIQLFCAHSVVQRVQADYLRNRAQSDFRTYELDSIFVHEKMI